MKTNNGFIALLIYMVGLYGCGPGKKNGDVSGPSAYEDDVAFLRKFSDVIELTDPDNKSQIAVMPALQARVMTSTAGGAASYGWINRSWFEAGDTSIHMNAFGGEERFWLGPEGGQFSLFFKKGTPFTLENWHTPKLIDLDPFDLVSKTPHEATFTKTASLVNYSGAVFNVTINRKISVLSAKEALDRLGITFDATPSLVAYKTTNQLQNAGDNVWKEETGLLSIWLLGMFKPSQEVTMVIPFKEGAVDSLGPIVKDDYFGRVPVERLKIAQGALFFRGDGEYRSKIGLSSPRAKGIMGSYDAGTSTLTIIKYNQGAPGDRYVNSSWEIQANPFHGDVVNAYNDGPAVPGAKPMGPFYELESSSPAKELEPGQSVTHEQTTFHFQGGEKELNELTTKILGVSITEIKSAFD